jgi:hypothetical protein
MDPFSGAMGVALTAGVPDGATTLGAAADEQPTTTRAAASSAMRTTMSGRW